MNYENPATGATVDTSVLREERLQRTETSPLAPAPTCPLLEGPAGSDGTYTKPPWQAKGCGFVAKPSANRQ